jgi:CheY-like chemotaxis protein
MASILVVDDSAVIRRVLELTLKRAGHLAVMASNGSEALDCLARHSIDLAFIDLDMPTMDGLTLVHKMRADERYRSVPVVVLTASGEDEDRSLAETEGVDAFLAKPASSQRLTDVVDRLLGKRA